MKHKTAMMELIEKLYLRLNYHLESLSPSPEIIELMIKDATQLLEKEKEQIIDAANQTEFEDIHNFGVCEDTTKGEQYYNETYKQN